MHETKWVKKLEEYVPADRNKGEDHQDTHEEKDEDSDEAPSNGFQPRSSERSRKHRGGNRYNEENPQSSEEKEEEESSIEQMLQTGAFKKNLLAHRNKVVHIKSVSQQEDEEANEEEGAGEESQEHHSYYANQYWKAPEICDTTLEDLLKEEGFYELQ